MPRKKLARTLSTWAQELGYDDAVELLEALRREEHPQNIDDVAKSVVNVEAERTVIACRISSPALQVGLLIWANAPERRPDLLECARVPPLFETRQRGQAREIFAACPNGAAIPFQTNFFRASPDSSPPPQPTHARFCRRAASQRQAI